MTLKRRPAPRGFSLAEAITAMVILAAAIPAMLWAVRLAHTHRTNRVMMSRAHWLAVERLEDVVADRHSATRGYTYLISANYPAENPVAGFPGYSRTVALSETAANLSGPGTGYMRVTVTVSYTDYSGTARSLALATELTNYTP